MNRFGVQLKICCAIGCFLSYSSLAAFSGFAAAAHATGASLLGVTPNLPEFSAITALDKDSPLFALPTVDAVLGGLQPPTKMPLGQGNDLLLDFPDVVASGKVDVRLVSTLLRTDGLWLLTLQPAANKGSLLAAYAIDAAEPASSDIVTTVTLDRTQTLMLVVRSLGKYYAVQRQIKVGSAIATPRRAQ